MRRQQQLRQQPGRTRRRPAPPRRPLRPTPSQATAPTLRPARCQPAAPAGSSRCQCRRSARCLPAAASSTSWRACRHGRPPGCPHPQRPCWRLPSLRMSGWRRQQPSLDQNLRQPQLARQAAAARAASQQRQRRLLWRWLRRQERRARRLRALQLWRSPLPCCPVRPGVGRLGLQDSVWRAVGLGLRRRKAAAWARLWAQPHPPSLLLPSCCSARPGSGRGGCQRARQRAAVQRPASHAAGAAALLAQPGDAGACRRRRSRRGGSR